MVTVWWFGARLIHYSFMKPGTTITAAAYCKQLDDMMKKLEKKQPKLVNRLSPLLLQDNTLLESRTKTAGVGIGNSPSPTVFARPYTYGLPFL